MAAALTNGAEARRQGGLDVNNAERLQAVFFVVGFSLACFFWEKQPLRTSNFGKDLLHRFKKFETFSLQLPDDAFARCGPSVYQLEG
ncbi:hypothetical protein N7490_002543 [Penicillium lividum]|nr:hypothetical protein N7490_002543 [Penicillium lividum]